MQSKEIGQRIKQIRTEIAKASQFEFSEQVCVTQSNLSMLENGKTYPSCFLLIKLNIVYKININWLLTGKEEMILPLLLAIPNTNNAEIA